MKNSQFQIHHGFNRNLTFSLKVKNKKEGIMQSCTVSEVDVMQESTAF